MAGVEDRGFAWVVCAASFMNLLMSGGFLFASGIFYIMFKNGLNAGDSELSLIISLNTGATLAICPIAGMLSVRHGERLVAMIGGMISTVALVSSAFSTQVYQLYILYGVATGIGMGMVFNTSISITDKYFIKYRRAACGLALSGLGCGSFIFPAVLTLLEDTYGWRGAIIMVAGIYAQTIVFSSFFRPTKLSTRGKKLTIDRERMVDDPCLDLMIEKSSFSTSKEFSLSSDDRMTTQDKSGQAATTTEGKELTPQRFTSIKNNTQGDEKQEGNPNNDLSVLSLFRNIPLLCLSFLALVITFSVSIVYTHFGSYALTLGISGENVVLLYTVMGIISTITRPLTAVIVEITDINSATLMVCSVVMLGILTAMMPIADQLWAMYMYVIFFQIFMSPYNSLSHAMAMGSVSKSKASFALGIPNMFAMPGHLSGPPVAAWLYGVTGDYRNVFYMAGAFFILSGLTMVPSAYHTHRRRRRTLATREH